jgi:hypothetical protein
MFFMPSFPDEPPEFTAAEIEAMAGTLARVKETLADIVQRERTRAQGLIAGGYLTREGLDAATESLGMEAVSDQEWSELRDRRGGMG